ncbi:MAG TPA: acyl-CoA synthetase [Usitatibacter sp.]|nr:acyl-CoA synthetase [Usitatibacter sp.]
MNPPAGAAQWRLTPERGSMPMIRLMARLSLLLGRSPSRVLLYAVAAYFLAFGGAARRASREYLGRALGRPSTLRESYRHFLTFATTVHDRIYLLKGRFDLFDIEVRGAELFGPEGALLMGAHFGSFEALRACGRKLGHRRVAMTMYEENARKVAAVLDAISPAASEDIVALGRPEAMLELRGLLEQGALVGVLADRTPGDDPVIEVEFLGLPARFPTGPMRMAAVLRQRVIFMAGVHLGGNRYEVGFEPLVDFSGLGELLPEARAQHVADAVRAYAGVLERHVRAAPWNWFNFYDFWGKA